MGYFMEFHWWYLLVGVIFLIVMLFRSGEGRGGLVVKRFTATMEILDERFDGCEPEAIYSIFKEGEPDHIDIEVEKLALEVGEELEFQLNGVTLAKVQVKRNKEAEFDYWSDEGVEFSAVKAGDKLVIKYQGVDVLKGEFQLD